MASPGLAYDPPPVPNTAYVTITFTTNCAASQPTVTVTGQCFDSSGNVIPSRNFDGQGTEDLGPVVSNCPVKFVWTERTSTPVTCSEFKLFFSNASVSTEPSPFASPSFEQTFSPVLNSGDTVLHQNIVNGNANWQYSGHLFLLINGSTTPTVVTFDPQLEIEDIG